MNIQELYRLLAPQPDVIEKLDAVRCEIDLQKAEDIMSRLLDRKTAAEAYQDLKLYLQDDVDNWKMLYWIELD